jgi:hypothetical protein
MRLVLRFYSDMLDHVGNIRRRLERKAGGAMHDCDWTIESAAMLSDRVLGATGIDLRGRRQSVNIVLVKKC